MAAWTEEELKVSLENVAERARNNADFRARALKDAAAVLMEVSGKDSAPPVNFRFVEMDEELGIRFTEVTESEELTDDQLEQIAGGGRQPPHSVDMPIERGVFYRRTFLG